MPARSLLGHPIGIGTELLDVVGVKIIGNALVAGDLERETAQDLILVRLAWAGRRDELHIAMECVTNENLKGRGRDDLRFLPIGSRGPDFRFGHLFLDPGYSLPTEGGSHPVSTSGWAISDRQSKGVMLPQVVGQWLSQASA